MGQWDQWTSFRLRLKSSAGVLLYTWQPASTVWMKSLRVTYRAETEDRETAGGANYPSFRGWRAHLVLVMETLSGHFAGSGVTTTLETVIAAHAANVGSYFEIALKPIAGIDVYDYKRVNLLSGYEPEELGAQAGMRLRLEFEGAALQTSWAARDTSGGSW